MSRENIDAPKDNASQTESIKTGQRSKWLVFLVFGSIAVLMLGFSQVMDAYHTSVFGATTAELEQAVQRTFPDY